MGSKEINIGELYPKDTISFFDGDYEFLSNFHEAKIKVKGHEYPTAEHAYQVMKCVTDENIEHIKTLTAGQAKRYMGKQELREDWDKVKVFIMYEIVKEKFTCHKYLRDRLIKTGNRVIVEGNYWGDQFWGVYEGEGENYLGNILMIVRSELQGEGGRVDLGRLIEENR